MLARPYCVVYQDTPADLLVRNPRGDEYWVSEDAWESWEPHVRSTLTVVDTWEDYYERATGA